MNPALNFRLMNRFHADTLRSKLSGINRCLVQPYSALPPAAEGWLIAVAIAGKAIVVTRGDFISGVKAIIVVIAHREKLPL